MGANNRSASLPSLLQNLPLEILSSVPNAVVTGIASDSRTVQPGDLFVALTGETADGHRFIPDAIERGAVAVVGMQDLSGLAVPYVRLADSRRALAHLAAAFYGFPARQLIMIGVTGTDGKTTTSNLIFHILKAAGLRAGMINTVNAVIGAESLDTGFHVTTPDPIDVQRYLWRMAEAGLTHVVLEATSHGLAQFRVDACEFDVGVVTNITHEHLDYHGSYDAYRAAKARMFTGLADTQQKGFLTPRTAILNRDDASFDYLSRVTRVRTVSYGFHSEAELRAENVSHTQQGMEFSAVGQGHSFSVSSNLVGNYNVSNCLAAIAVTVSVLGLDPAHAHAGIASMSGVPGRMERLDLGQDFTAIVDFAHTPNALRVTLETAREMLAPREKPGRVIVVFGSAGLRDKAKRLMMAETSAEKADVTILTAEDPRTESLDAILQEMAKGAAARGKEEGKDFWRIKDRGDAIRFAVSQARPGDLVIACGKGHEQSMCFGATEYTWDDRTAMRAALSEHLGIPGPEMPYLPTRLRP